MRLSPSTFFSAVSATILIVVCLFSAKADAQTAQRNAQAPDNRPRTASIGGRVTVSGKPAANATVFVMEVDPKSQGDWAAAFDKTGRQLAFVKVRTDGDGRYQVTGLTEGAYLIHALSKAFVRANNPSDFETTRPITLDEGESRNDVDIALLRGGVITGRVSDAAGAPLISAYLELLLFDENGKPQGGFQTNNYRMMNTDDRGVYRLYGLPAGRYRLCVRPQRSVRRGKGIYPRTCYPNATDQNLAKNIEVKEGDEITGIDIRLGDVKSAYEVTGQVIDAETGQPLPQMVLMCMGARDNTNEQTYSGGDAITDEEGRFSFKGILSGRYNVGLWDRGLGNKDYYSEQNKFEVQDGDVNGLVVKAIRGSTVSGAVVVEGVNDAGIKSKLQQMRLVMNVMRPREQPENETMYWDRGGGNAKIAADGSFVLSGARPGMASFYVWGPEENIFSVVRVERNGAEVKNGFEIKRGEQISGVRIVLVSASGTIRGQVEIGGGRLPDGWQLILEATLAGTTENKDEYPTIQQRNYSTSADNKGRFVIERMVTGEYELKLTPVIRLNQNEWKTPPELENIKQRVIVNSGSETQVKFTFDPARKQENR